ncbi:unnamed protein product [Gongylonema pulchrum]|uniref:J domain-containing protein n=1 Tax=Gongylonema pulchrum TaxID=637853 RepID=A0A183ELX9_9BILA|nr:unnamed protein product [Gongylonema pulchrum]
MFFARLVMRRFIHSSKRLRQGKTDYSKNYYEILEVGRDATQQQIKNAFYTLSKKVFEEMRRRAEEYEKMRREEEERYWKFYQRERERYNRRHEMPPRPSVKIAIDRRVLSDEERNDEQSKFDEMILRQRYVRDLGHAEDVSDMPGQKVVQCIC